MSDKNDTSSMSDKNNTNDTDETTDNADTKHTFTDPGPMPASEMKSPIPSFVSPIIGKTVRTIARLRSGGSAIPGKVVEAIDPQFLARCMAQLPLGVVLVSGTNGKTTTTRIITSVLRELGLKVFTNPTGSNFVRGVVSALVEQVDLHGRIDADIAVLELDEAYAVHFVHQVKPRYSLLLNVMRDQLDRFGEIDTTARLLSNVAMATTAALVLNREDKRIAALEEYRLPEARVKYFGLDPSLRHYFPTDDDMYTADMYAAESPTAGAGGSAWDALSHKSIAEMADAISSSLPSYLADVVLESFDSHHAQFVVGNEERIGTDLKLEGIYNIFNAAGAFAVVRSVVADAQMTSRTARSARRSGKESGEPILPAKDVEKYDEEIAAALSKVTPAFGRGESIDYHGTQVELVLVKNPAGFRLALNSFNPAGAHTMIAINDEYADGRDMSWLWDVDFTSLQPEGNTSEGVSMVSGVRCWDMALRLGYDAVSIGAVEPDLTAAVDKFLSADGSGAPATKRIYCTYTAMLALRAHISTLTDVNDSGLK